MMGWGTSLGYLYHKSFLRTRVVVDPYERGRVVEGLVMMILMDWKTVRSMLWQCRPKNEGAGDGGRGGRYLAPVCRDNGVADRESRNRRE